MKFVIVIITVGYYLMIVSDVVYNQAPFLLECRIPEDSSLNNSIRVNLTEEEKEQLDLEGRCFLACAIRVYKVNHCNVKGL